MSENNKKKGTFYKGWILGIINGINANTLAQMIKENQMIWMFDYELPDYLKGLKPLISANKDMILEYINYEAAKDYCLEYRPDLYEIMVHPAGKKWMERFLKQLVFIIENIDLNPIDMKLRFFQRIKEARDLRKLQEPAQPVQIKEPEKTIITDVKPKLEIQEGTNESFIAELENLPQPEMVIKKIKESISASTDGINKDKNIFDMYG